MAVLNFFVQTSFCMVNVILDLLYLVGNKATQPLLRERFRSDQLGQGSWQGNDKVLEPPRREQCPWHTCLRSGKAVFRMNTVLSREHVHLYTECVHMYTE